MRDRFWEHFALDQLEQDEWEALCDGCGRCCLVKLEDEDTGELHFTDVVCRYLDTQTCRCTSYATRLKVVPDCLQVSVDIAQRYDWLPASCAYRRLARGEQLPTWHPLLTGTRTSVVDAGISVRGKVISEALVPEDLLEERIVQWVR
ncbi:MAG: YcgN family cysteine cluster protein [Alcanivoracaceae bacterium]|nr:YcgN family cysteine cluster protein [Alcanivoracaceae bacterium]